MRGWKDSYCLVLAPMAAHPAEFVQPVAASQHPEAEAHR